MNRYKPFHFFILNILVFLIVGCDGSLPVIDITEQDNYYSLYGYLLTDADTSFIRVVPVRGTLSRSSGPIDAEVTSQNLTTGQWTTWNDSLVQNYDGTSGHVFWANLSIKPQQNHKIEVRRSDGKYSHAVVKVPKRPGRVRVHDVYRFRDYTTKLVICDQDVEWRTAAPRTFVANVIYVVQTTGPGSGLIEIDIPYADSLTRTDGGWSTTVNLLADREHVDDRLRDIIDFGIATAIILHEMRLYVVVPHTSWNPPGGYDPFVLSNPGLFSNVENGFGFIGGAADTTYRWQLPKDVLEDLNYYTRD